MLRDIDNYYLQHEEPIKSCLQSLRAFILTRDEQITEEWRYGMPFYFYKGRRCCYLWVHKKLRQPYLGIVAGRYIDHPDLIAEKRSRMKIMLIDANKDIPVKKLNTLLKKMMAIHAGL